MILADHKKHSRADQDPDGKLKLRIIKIAGKGGHFRGGWQMIFAKHKKPHLQS